MVPMSFQGSSSAASSGQLDQMQNMKAAGFRGPTVNIATGRSDLSSSPSAGESPNWLLLGGVAFVGYLLWRRRKGGAS